MTIKELREELDKLVQSGVSEDSLVKVQVYDFNNDWHELLI